MAGSYGAPNKGGADVSMKMVNLTAAAGLESLEMDEKTTDEIINNVEKMIKAEKAKDQAAKKDKKADLKSLDLANTTAVRGNVSDKLSNTNRSTEQSSDATSEAELGGGALDQNMALIRRKTIAIKSDNVSATLMQNIGAITESVSQF